MFQSLSFKNRAFETTWLVFLVLYCISVFVSKSGLSIFGGLLILQSLFVIDWQDLKQHRKELLVFVALYPLAVFLAFFSNGGATSALKTAASWPWVLLALPAYVVLGRKKDQKVALVASCVGLVVSCGKALVIFFTQFQGHFDSSVRVASFWDISRWGVFLAASIVGLLALIVYFSDRKNSKLAYILQALLGLAAVCLVFSNTRGPWVSAAIGGLVMTVLFPRLLKMVAALGVIVVLALVSNQGIRDRAFSIVNVQKTEDGRITSTDRSNEGRLNMWEVGQEFFWEQPWFGTGFENGEQYLRDYIERRGPEYHDKYVTTEFSFRDQHSSYLTMLVQMGGIFSAVFWAVCLRFGFLFLKSYFQTRSLWAGAVLALMASFVFIFVFYSSVLSYEMVALFPFVALIPKKTA